MSVRNLDYLFKPKSVALIGPSKQPGTAGSIIARNLFGSGFDGPILPVHPKYRSVEGVLAYPDVESLPFAPDLAVITTPLETVPRIIELLGHRGTRAAVVTSAGFVEPGGEGKRLQQAILDAAHTHLMRIVGPDTLGLQVPAISLNASLAHLPALGGGPAFVTHSGTVVTSVIDWANARRVGFSKLVALGDMADVDFGDMLDYLTDDSDTTAILLYMEGVSHTRKFMSAGRAAARTKPVIVVKSGRSQAGADDVYDAAFHRAGMLRVRTLGELLSAAATLSLLKPPRNNRLLIVTNSGSMGVLAADELADQDGALAELSGDTRQKLGTVLPATWSHGNPVDIIGDAPATRLRSAVRIILENEHDIDALLILICPTAAAPAMDSALAVAECIGEMRIRVPILTCWIGGETARAARRMLRTRGIAAYETLDQAISSFVQLVHFRQNQALLMETPPSAPESLAHDPGAVRAILQRGVSDDTSEGYWLSEADAKAVLNAYGIATVPAGIERSDAYELIAGMNRDSQFGAVLMFGEGGTATDLSQDTALGLPPLNMKLAMDMMSRTRIFKRMQGYRDRQSANHEAVAVTLLRLSQLVVDFPEFESLDINPLLADTAGVVALNTRIRVTRRTFKDRLAHLAIRPYPKELEETITLTDGRSMTLRPIVPEDEPALNRGFARLDPDEIRNRFFQPMRTLNHMLAARFTQLDYDREMAFVLVDNDTAGKQDIHAVVRLSADPDNEEAEFAIIVQHALAGQGLGRLLMDRILTRAKDRGISTVWGVTLRENQRMRALAKAMGFQQRTDPEDPSLVRMEITLDEPS